MGRSEDTHAQIWPHHIKDILRGIVSFQERVLYSCVIANAWTGLLLMVILIPSLREELLYAFYRWANRNRKNYVHKSQSWNLPRMIGNITKRPLHHCVQVEILAHKSGPHCVTWLHRPKAELVWYVKSIVWYVHSRWQCRPRGCESITALLCNVYKLFATSDLTPARGTYFPLY